MSEGYQEDLNMYGEAGKAGEKNLDTEALLRSIRYLNYRTPAPCISPETTTGEALRLMMEQKTGALLVIEGGKLIGIFAERDLLLKQLYDSEKLVRPVREYMTPNPDCLTPDDSIAFALNRMARGGYRHVPLITPDEKPVGLVSMRTVMEYIVTFFPAEVINVPPHSEVNPPDHSAEGG